MEVESKGHSITVKSDDTKYVYDGIKEEIKLNNIVKDAYKLGVKSKKETEEEYVKVWILMGVISLFYISYLVLTGKIR